jgi:hypothetical protein
MSGNYTLYAQKMAELKAARRAAAHPLRKDLVEQLEDLLKTVSWCERVWSIEDRIEKSS